MVYKTDILGPLYKKCHMNNTLFFISLNICEKHLLGQGVPLVPQIKTDMRAGVTSLRL